MILSTIPKISIERKRTKSIKKAQIYDCELEAKAENKLKPPEVQLPEEYATVEFRFQNRGREGHYSHALELEMGIDMFKDEDKLRVMINPRATRYGLGITAGERTATALYLRQEVR
ncbi:hypothetical protein OESDEN_04559 [Oesophagostomum dentatum]|uniref:Uncharacterized protein n=1 Tax=Oesophagostomum dentatum TaxID=61180 RepID=A0A0B1TI39_OESDE|nr:hypothetical protein OESDEN_04559 [Oesophagostomum dentatum]